MVWFRYTSTLTVDFYSLVVPSRSEPEVTVIMNIYSNNGSREGKKNRRKFIAFFGIAVHEWAIDDFHLYPIVMIKN